MYNFYVLLFSSKMRLLALVSPLVLIHEVVRAVTVNLTGPWAGHKQMSNHRLLQI